VLIYLDTAHLALLERTAAADATKFWSAWQTCECELALSLHHLQEIGQLSDRASVERRLKALEPFSVIRSLPAGSEQVLRIEVQVQLFQKLGFSIDGRKSVMDAVFPPAQLSELKGMIGFQGLFKQMRAALELGTEGSNLAKQAAQQEDHQASHMEVDPELILEAALADLPNDVAGWMRQLFQQIGQTVLEQGTVRGGLERIYGLEGLEIMAKIPDSDLPAASIYFNCAREEIAAVLERAGAPLSRTDQLLNLLDPYQAPGFALQLAAERARQLHPKPDQPGDQIDVTHIAFAPYVDLAFVDKRTLGFLTQEARDRPQLLSKDLIQNIRRAGTLDRVSEVILEQRRITTDFASQQP
jgi:hypothetical protein